MSAKQKHGDREHRALARFAAECAARVLPLFEAKHPRDRRPRDALAILRAWERGEVDMMTARRAAVLAHAAARRAKDPAAIAAARAAGQAVATAHSRFHASAAAGYAAKAVAEAERAWQRQQLPARLRHHAHSALRA